MAAQVDVEKCKMCGGIEQPICIEVCPDDAVRIQNGRIVITEFLCEDCNECGCACPDRAIQIPLDKITF